MKVSPTPAIILALIALCLPACNLHKEEHQEEAHQILATNPQLQAVTLTQQFVCQIHSQRHIKVRALQTGYLEAIKVREGQHVKEGDVLFKVVPILYQKKAEVELAEAKLAELKLNYNKELLKKNVISENMLKVIQTELAKARAEADLAIAELNFATVKAPFDGIIDRLYQQQGNLVEDGEILTTLSDNSVMWVYFNLPEKRYLEYMANLKQNKDLKIELLLASGNKFDQLGTIGAIEADFNNETGNIPFRADFKNPIISHRKDGQPERLLRHGQTGTVLLSWVENDALVIPQRATFEVLAKRYVYAIDEENVAHQREIAIENELEDLFVIKKGEVGVNDKIILEGIRQVRDGEKVEFEDRQPEEVAANLKYHAE
ncbi:MAG TPA: efflux RND transporter periplasmic adaptor subunit [Pirellulales bacterium]|nr:efflux RND transporter periplasmic adaptor subunit [Pirellulales bacterium]